MAISLSATTPLPQFIPAFLTMEYMHSNSLRALKVDIKWFLLWQTIHGLQRPRPRETKWWRILLLHEGFLNWWDYKTFHRYSIHVQPNDIFPSETKSTAAKLIQMLLSLENFIMVMQQVLKTITCSSMQFIREDATVPHGTLLFIRCTDSVSTGKSGTQSYLERQLSGINSTARGRNDLT